LIAALGLYEKEHSPLQFCGLLLWFSIAFIAVAGLAGGVIASTLPEMDSLTGSGGFFSQRTGPWGWKPLSMSGRAWTRVEHTAFWIALLVAVAAFIVPEYLGEAPHFCSFSSTTH
jgi:hypothetical protein